MWQKIVSFLKLEWLKRKNDLVDKLIAELDKTKPELNRIVVEKIKNAYSEADLSKMSLEEILGLGLDIAYAEITTIVKRQI